VYYFHKTYIAAKRLILIQRGSVIFKEGLLTGKIVGSLGINIPRNHDGSYSRTVVFVNEGKRG
jgi:hypothetical protein